MKPSGPKEWVLLEGGNHVCNNMPFRYRPLIGDFLAKTPGGADGLTMFRFSIVGSFTVCRRTSLSRSM